MDETLTGRTTREVTFADKAEKVFTFGVRKPAGTLVYVTCPKAGRGIFRVRVPGTLLEQDVPLSAVEPED
jgi:hypothetical protein